MGEIATDAVAWTDQQTGEFVTQLGAQFRAHASAIDGSKEFTEGIAEAKKNCALATRPWLDKLVEQAKATVAEELRRNQEARR